MKSFDCERLCFYSQKFRFRIQFIIEQVTAFVLFVHLQTEHATELKPSLHGTDFRQVNSVDQR